MMQSSTHRPPLQILRKKTMDYVKKIQRMDEHLRQHPHDYQTVIARLKLASKAVDYEYHKVSCMRLKRLAEIKKRLREEDKAHGYK